MSDCANKTDPENAPLIGLSIAGFDPSGGAGVLADLKTFAAHGVYGEACLTTLTVQSTAGVRKTQPADPAWVAETLACLADDNPLSVIKIGALGSLAIVHVIAEFLRRNPAVPVVLDPVFASSNGIPLLDKDAIEFVRAELLTLVSWVTPNLAELAVLTGRPVTTSDEVEKAAQLVELTPSKINLLVTGGHLKTPDDYLILPGEQHGRWIAGNRVKTRATHGTGCTLSSAIAARLARFPGESPETTVTEAKRYLEGAMLAAPEVGRGPGPVQHFWQMHFQKPHFEPPE
jgi:hydroxymethylpyrimidine/phosphomethylpyrimidine kinase